MNKLKFTHRNPPQDPVFQPFLWHYHGSQSCESDGGGVRAALTFLRHLFSLKGQPTSRLWSTVVPLVHSGITTVVMLPGALVGMEKAAEARAMVAKMGCVRRIVVVTCDVLLSLRW